MRLFIAVPSAINSGFEIIEKVLISLLQQLKSIFLIISAVLTGNVLFSTIIVWSFANFAICLTDSSREERSLAKPEPIPRDFVGVLTEMKIISALLIDSSIFVVKNKLRFLWSLTISLSPG